MNYSICSLRFFEAPNRAIMIQRRLHNNKFFGNRIRKQGAESMVLQESSLFWERNENEILVLNS